MPRASRPEPAFAPFADDAAVRTIAGISIENGRERIAVHGSLEIAKDRTGLAQARALRGTLDAIVAALEAADLPEAVAETKRPTSRVKNPFA